MRTLSQKPPQDQSTLSAPSARASECQIAQTPVDAVLQMQRMIGNQGVQRWLRHREQLPSPSATRIQRALPAITLPGNPDLSTMDPGIRTRLRGLWHNWRDTGGNERSALAATALATSWLEDQGLVQYSGQQDIDAGSPFYLRTFSDHATTAMGSQQLDIGETSGFTFPRTNPVRYRVEIYPKALLADSADDGIGSLLGVIVHEYMHILQNRAGQAGPGPMVSAEGEFQAYLWQAEHLSDLGIGSRSYTSRQIGIQLDRYFRLLSQDDQDDFRQRYDAARRALNAPRSAPP